MAGPRRIRSYSWYPFPDPIECPRNEQRRPLLIVATVSRTPLYALLYSFQHSASVMLRTALLLVASASLPSSPFALVPSALPFLLVSFTSLFAFLCYYSMKKEVKSVFSYLFCLNLLLHLETNAIPFPPLCYVPTKTVWATDMYMFIWICCSGCKAAAFISIR